MQKLKKFKVKRHDKRSHDVQYIEIFGVDLIDAVKRHFLDILDVCTYDFIAFRFPMTIRPSFSHSYLKGTVTKRLVPAPDDKSFMEVEYKPEYEGVAKFLLEWQYSDHTKKPETLHTHTIYIDANESDLPSTEPFVILGN